MRLANIVGAREGVASLGVALHLPVFELDRGEPAENGNGNLELAAVRIDLVDAAGEIRERAIVDLHFFADGVDDLRDFLAVGGFDARADLVDLRLTQRRRLIATDETDDAGN